MPTDLTQNSSGSRIPDIRLRPETQKLLDNLGLLQHLPGTWIGTGFNLIAATVCADQRTAQRFLP